MVIVKGIWGEVVEGLVADSVTSQAVSLGMMLVYDPARGSLNSVGHRVTRMVAALQTQSTDPSEL